MKISESQLMELIVKLQSSALGCLAEEGKYRALDLICEISNQQSVDIKEIE